MPWGIPHLLGSSRAWVKLIWKLRNKSWFWRRLQRQGRSVSTVFLREEQHSTEGVVALRESWQGIRLAPHDGVFVCPATPETAMATAIATKNKPMFFFSIETSSS